MDDDEDDYIVMREMLSDIKPWKVDLQWGPSCEQALQSIKPGSHDLCLMDYRLDRGTGLDLMHELHKNGFSAPVIVLTGKGDHEVYRSRFGITVAGSI